MGNTIKPLYRGVPGTSIADAYTVPAATSTVLGTIVATNTTASAANFSVSVAPLGAADAASQYVVKAFVVAANDILVIKLDTAMIATDKIRVMQGTASAINLYISGMETA